MIPEKQDIRCPSSALPRVFGLRHIMGCPLRLLFLSFVLDYSLVILPFLVFQFIAWTGVTDQGSVLSKYITLLSSFLSSSRGPGLLEFSLCSSRILNLSLRRDYETKKRPFGPCSLISIVKILSMCTVFLSGPGRPNFSAVPTTARTCLSTAENIRVEKGNSPRALRFCPLSVVRSPFSVSGRMIQILRPKVDFH